MACDCNSLLRGIRFWIKDLFFLKLLLVASVLHTAVLSFFLILHTYTWSRETTSTLITHSQTGCVHKGEGRVWPRTRVLLRILFSCSVYIDLEDSVEEMVAFVERGKDGKINILRRLEKGLLDEIETIFSCISQLPSEYMCMLLRLSYCWSGE